jgi:hypothetical protein
MALALSAGIAAQSQGQAQDTRREAPVGSVTMTGCVERWSAGATGSGTLGSAAANPATTQGAYKLSKVEMKAGTADETTDRKEAGSKDVRLMTHDDKIDLSKHVGHKVELTGGWSNSPDTMGTGVSSTGQGGSGTGGTATGSNRGNAGQGGSAISNPANGELNRVLIVTALKMVSASCDGR